MLKQFGEYLLANRQRAAIMALLFSFLPLFGWISMVIIGLVTLRKGLIEGLWIVLWASLADMTAVFLGYPDALLFGFLGGNVLVWVLAGVLSFTASWTIVLEASLLIGSLTIILIHLFYPEITVWWLTKYQLMMTKPYADVTVLAESFGFSNEKEWTVFVKTIKESDALAIMARVSTGVIIALILGIRMIKLVMARWWQALLFNPKGLRLELYSIRLGYLSSGFLVLFMVSAFAGMEIAWDVLPIFVMIFLLAGLSLVHQLVASLKTGLIILFIIYCLLVILTPYCIVALVTLALLDSIIDIRHRVLRKNLN